MVLLGYPSAGSNEFTSRELEGFQVTKPKALTVQEILDRPKYRATLQANGRYKIGVYAGIDATSGDISWVSASHTEFETLHDAAMGIMRLAKPLKEREWLFDVKGDPLDPL